MRLRKMQAKRRAREWDAFHARVYEPLTMKEFKLFREALTLEGEAWDRFIQYLGAILGQEDVDQWITWATAMQGVQSQGKVPEDIPKPPAEPTALWDTARRVADEIGEHEMKCAGGYVLALLSYARNIR